MVILNWSYSPLLIKAMSRYENIKFILISPRELQVPKYIKTEVLDRKLIDYIEVERLEEVIESLDILYMTRVQKRFSMRQII